MRRQIWLLPAAAMALALAAWCGQRGTADSLEGGFRNPPPEARLRCYWWWLNGNTDQPTITSDLEAMKANGYGGAMLAAQGAIVIGPKPIHMTGIDTSKGELGYLVDRLWGTCDGASVHEQRYGNGRVVCGKATREVLAEEHVSPDFEFAGAHTDSSLDFVHRRTPSAEIYFIRNARAHPETAQISVRVSGKQPELWFADTGKIMRPAVFDFTLDGRTRMPLTLEPYGSVFVLFRQAAEPHVTRLTRNGTLLFPASPPPNEFPVVWRTHGTVRMESARAGQYDAVTADGTHLNAAFRNSALQQEVKGIWEVRSVEPKHNYAYIHN